MACRSAERDGSLRQVANLQHADEYQAQQSVGREMLKVVNGWVEPREVRERMGRNVYSMETLMDPISTTVGQPTTTVNGENQLVPEGASDNVDKVHQ